MVHEIGDAIRAKTGHRIDQRRVMARRDYQYMIASLLVHVAKIDGAISTEETAKMLEITQSRFKTSSAEALGVLTEAVTALTDEPELVELLRELKDVLAPADKEEIALMLLELIAADGKRETKEMEVFRFVTDLLGVTPDRLHNAFERFFLE